MPPRVERAHLLDEPSRRVVRGVRLVSVEEQKEGLVPMLFQESVRRGHELGQAVRIARPRIDVAGVHNLVGLEAAVQAEDRS